MTNLVQFPGLGLSFEINRVALSIGGFNIYWYGVCIAFGICLALVFAFRHSIEFGVDPDSMVDVILIGIVLGIVSARAYYVAMAPFKYESIWEMIAIRDGGLAIYGGVIAGFLPAFLFSRCKKLSFWALADCCVQGLFIGQAIGRWGNFFNCEAFGGFGVQTDTADRGAFGLHGAKGVGAVFYVHGKFEGSRIFADSHIFSSFHNLVLFFVFVTRGYSALFSFYFFIMQLSSRSKLRKEACAL